MRDLLLDFNQFNKKYHIFEEATSIESNPDSMFMVTDNAEDKAGAQKFIDAVSAMDSAKLKANLDKILAVGESKVAGMQKAWDQRAKLDSGELKKIEGGWYVGKGAWRLNSNKAVKLGLTPKWMKLWFDPMHDEILNKYFPELEKGESYISPEGELKGFEKGERAPGEVALPKSIEKEEAEYADELEKELEMAESLKYVKRIYEQDEFHLGPPTSVEGEAIVVTPDDLIAKLKKNYKMKHRANIMIWGAPGIGKTDIVKQAAQELADELGNEICVMIVTLAQMQPYDLNGIPLLFSKEGSGETISPLAQRGAIQMDFAVPAWLPGKGDSDQGILFFDEINRAQPDMLASALTLLLDRKAQKYTMPTGWRVWAAGNRDMDGPVQPFEAAVASRFLGGHVHLIPTVESWIKWARSEKGYYKDIEGTNEKQWYIPDEFLTFLRHYEISGEGKAKDAELKSAKFTDRAGNPIKSKFQYFYNFDKAKLAASGMGVSVGFPTPRNWAEGFKLVYAQILSDPKYTDNISKDVDAKKGIISNFSIAIDDRTDKKDIEDLLAGVVGRNASVTFINYALMLSRHNDADGTLTEKVRNVVKNPAGNRPLLNIPRISNPSEVFAIFSLVQGEIESMGSDFGPDEFLNWAQYAVDIVKKEKVKEGEATSHVSAILSFAPNVFMQATKKASSDPKAAKVLKEFTEVYREIISRFKNL